MMKILVSVLCAIAAVRSAKVTVTLPTNETPSENKPVAILQQDSEVNPDGSHYNVWESANGIKVQEEGSIKISDDEKFVHTVNGKITYNDENGNPIVLTYVADENGYQPQGDHLPTAPPIPKFIARALEYAKTHPYVEKENTDAKNTQT